MVYPNSHIWIFYKNSISVSVVNISAQHISCMVTIGENSVSVACSIVYASNKFVDRRNLWVELTEEAESVNGPWMLMGDFNAVTHLDEKAGGRQFGTKSSDDFSNFIVLNGLIDLGFTWCNN